MSDRIEIKLTKVDPKKHSVRFDSADPNALVASIYIKNVGLEKLGDYSKGITVVIIANK